MRTINVKLKTGDSKEVSLDKLDVINRNKIFKTYLNLKEVMKKKTTDEEEKNISELLKNPDDIFDFMADCLKVTLKGVSLSELEGSEADDIFSANAEYILGMSSGAAKN